MSHLPRAYCLCREGVRLSSAAAMAQPGVVAMFCKCFVRNLTRNERRLAQTKRNGNMDVGGVDFLGKV